MCDSVTWLHGPANLVQRSSNAAVPSAAGQRQPWSVKSSPCLDSCSQVTGVNDIAFSTQQFPGKPRFSGAYANPEDFFLSFVDGTVRFCYVVEKRPRRLAGPLAALLAPPWHEPKSFFYFQLEGRQSRTLGHRIRAQYPLCTSGRN